MSCKKVTPLFKVVVEELLELKIDVNNKIKIMRINT
jgi:hypothetical protein